MRFQQVPGFFASWSRSTVPTLAPRVRSDECLNFGIPGAHPADAKTVDRCDDFETQRLVLVVLRLLSLRWQGARAVRLTAPFESDKFHRLDGLLIGGGDDISATLYGGAPAPDVRVDLQRDELEQSALTMLWKTDIPILGICWGAQMLNIYLGGRLHPDIYEVYHNAPKMRTPLPRKQVDVHEGSRLSAILDAPSIVVNALHHQSVEELEDGLEVSARDKYGIVQAIKAQGEAFRIGVQWHPELLVYRSPHRRLFQSFVHAANLNAARRSASGEVRAPRAIAAVRIGN